MKHLIISLILVISSCSINKGLPVYAFSGRYVRQNGCEILIFKKNNTGMAKFYPRTGLLHSDSISFSYKQKRNKVEILYDYTIPYKVEYIPSDTFGIRIYDEEYILSGYGGIATYKQEHFSANGEGFISLPEKLKNKRIKLSGGPGTSEISIKLKKGILNVQFFYISNPYQLKNQQKRRFKLVDGGLIEYGDFIGLYERTMCLCAKMEDRDSF